MDWADLDTPLYEAAQFPVEGPDNEAKSELSRVVAFRKAVRKAIPGARVVAIPNAGKRGQKALNQAKSEGVVWGFPDLMVLHDGRIAFFEFKAAKTQPKQHQIDCMNWLKEAGFNVACVRSPEYALGCLDSWGWPV